VRAHRAYRRLLREIDSAFRRRVSDALDLLRRSLQSALSFVRELSSSADLSSDVQQQVLSATLQGKEFCAGLGELRRVSLRIEAGLTCESLFEDPHFDRGHHLVGGVVVSFVGFLACLFVFVLLLFC
jgi:hypothetical protein